MSRAREVEGARAARRSCGYMPRHASDDRDANIVRDYEVGCKWAAAAVVALYALVTAMEVVSSWLQ